MTSKGANGPSKEFQQAERQLWGELGRKPTFGEVQARAETILRQRERPSGWDELRQTLGHTPKKDVWSPLWDLVLRLIPAVIAFGLAAVVIAVAAINGSRGWGAAAAAVATILFGAGIKSLAQAFEK